MPAALVTTLVMSEKFATLVGDDRIISRGKHALKGVAAHQEVFTLGAKMSENLQG